MTISETNWQKKTWRSLQRKKSYYKNKPVFFKNKKKASRFSLLKRYSRTNFEMNRSSFYWFFFDNSIRSLLDSQNHLATWHGTLKSISLPKISNNFSSFLSSVSFSYFVFCFLNGSVNPWSPSKFLHKKSFGWFLFSRFELYSNFFNFDNFKKVQTTSMSIFDNLISFIYSIFEKYYRIFFTSVQQKQWIFFMKCSLDSVSNIPQNVLFFSLRYLVSWNVLYGCSKKVWMSLSNYYCAFYLYKKDLVIFDASKTLQALKRAFYFLTSCVQRGSHIVFISWRFSEDFKYYFYDTAKQSNQSCSYGWFGGVLTNIKKLGLFSNLYFGLPLNQKEPLLAHEWLKIPSIFTDLDHDYFSLSYKYEEGSFSSRHSIISLNENYFTFFSLVKQFFSSCLGFFFSYAFKNILDIFNSIKKNILKFMNNVLLWFFFSKIENYFIELNKVSFFRFDQHNLRLITSKKKLPIVIKTKNVYTKPVGFTKLPNFFNSSKISTLKYLKSKFTSSFFSFKKTAFLKPRFNSFRLLANTNIFKTNKLKSKKLFSLNKFRPLKQSFFDKPKKLDALSSLISLKRFKPVTERIKKIILSYKRFSRRNRFFKKKRHGRWRYFFKYNFPFFLFFKKNIKKFRRFRIKKKLKRWKLLKSKFFKPQYRKFRHSFKKYFKKLFPTVAVLLNSTSLSMAQNDVINLSIPSVGILNSSNINGYFTYSVPANDDTERASLFHLNVFKASILKGQFFKKKLFFDNL